MHSGRRGELLRNLEVELRRLKAREHRLQEELGAGKRLRVEQYGKGAGHDKRTALTPRERAENMAELAEIARNLAMAEGRRRELQEMPRARARARPRGRPRRGRRR